MSRHSPEYWAGLALNLVMAGLPIFMPNDLKTKADVLDLMELYKRAKKRLQNGKNLYLCTALDDALFDKPTTAVYHYLDPQFQSIYSGCTLERYIFNRRDVFYRVLKAWINGSVIRGTITEDLLDRWPNLRIGFRLALLGVMENQAQAFYGKAGLWEPQKKDTETGCSV